MGCYWENCFVILVIVLVLLWFYVGEFCICIFLMCVIFLFIVGEGRNLINNYNIVVLKEWEFKNYIKNLILCKIWIWIYFK